MREVQLDEIAFRGVPENELFILSGSAAEANESSQKLSSRATVDREETDEPSSVVRLVIRAFPWMFIGMVLLILTIEVASGARSGPPPPDPITPSTPSPHWSTTESPHTTSEKPFSSTTESQSTSINAPFTSTTAALRPIWTVLMDKINDTR